MILKRAIRILDRCIIHGGPGCVCEGCMMPLGIPKTDTARHRWSGCFCEDCSVDRHQWQYIGKRTDINKTHRHFVEELKFTTYRCAVCKLEEDRNVGKTSHDTYWGG